MTLDELGFADVVELYKQKSQYTREGNLNELIRLKNSFPELFDERKEMEVTDLVNTVNYITSTPHFKAMREKEQKKKYIPINYHEWQMGRLEQVIARYQEIYMRNMDVIAREMIKEAIIGCWNILRLQKNPLVPIDHVFPYLGYLLGTLICQFPIERRQHKLKLTMFKLNGKECEIDERVLSKSSNRHLSLMEQTIEDYFYTLIQIVSQKFDQRDDFYSGAVFFCLMEAAEFIGLLIPHIGVGANLKADDVISSIFNNIYII